jgi:hypothetical protein
MKYLVLFFVFLLSMYSCKKKLFDYRNKYVGEYNFSGYNFVKGITAESVDTIFFNQINGELSYDRQLERDKMNLFIEDVISIEFTLNKSGSMSVCSEEGIIDEDYSLSVSFDKYICDYGKPLLGGKHIYTITGKKK